MNIHKIQTTEKDKDEFFRLYKKQTNEIMNDNDKWRYSDFEPSRDLREEIQALMCALDKVRELEAKK